MYINHRRLKEKKTNIKEEKDEEEEKRRNKKKDKQFVLLSYPSYYPSQNIVFYFLGFFVEYLNH